MKIRTMKTRNLPPEPFFTGIQCEDLGGDRFRLWLGEDKVEIKPTLRSLSLAWKTKDGKRRQRTMGVKSVMAALEGAVCFLRHVRRGGGQSNCSLN